MAVYSLVYASKTAIAPQNAADMAVIDAILATSRRRNEEVGVTGALLFTEGRFVQALEGDRATVRQTYDRIAADPRHSNVALLATQLGERRRFAAWSMAYVGNSKAFRGQFTAAPLAEIVSRAGGDGLLDFMMELARSADHERA